MVLTCKESVHFNDTAEIFWVVVTSLEVISPQPLVSKVRIGMKSDRESSSQLVTFWSVESPVSWGFNIPSAALAPCTSWPGLIAPSQRPIRDFYEYQWSALNRGKNGGCNGLNRKRMPRWEDDARVVCSCGAKWRDAFHVFKWHELEGKQTKKPPGSVSFGKNNRFGSNFKCVDWGGGVLWKIDLWLCTWHQAMVFNWIFQTPHLGSSWSYFLNWRYFSLHMSTKAQRHQSKGILHQSVSPSALPSLLLFQHHSQGGILKLLCWLCLYLGYQWTWAFGIIPHSFPVKHDNPTSLWKTWFEFFS